MSDSSPRAMRPARMPYVRGMVVEVQVMVDDGVIGVIELEQALQSLRSFV